MSPFPTLAAVVILATYPVAVRPLPAPAMMVDRSAAEWVIRVDARAARVIVRSGEWFCSFHKYPLDAVDAFESSLRSGAARRLNLTADGPNSVTVVLDSFQPTLLWKQGAAVLWGEPRAYVVLSGSISIEAGGAPPVIERFSIERSGGARGTLEACDAGSGALAAAVEGAQLELVTMLDGILADKAR